MTKPTSGEIPRRNSNRKPNSPPAGAIRTPITATSTRRSITPRRCSIAPPRTSWPGAASTSTAGAAPRPPRRWRWPSRPIDGPGLRGRRTAALRTCRHFDRPAVGGPRRRSRAGDRQLLRPDPQVLRRRAGPVRRLHHLLRSLDRRRHRGPDPAQHTGGVHRGSGLAVVRDAGHSRHRRGRTRARRAGADGQHLGEPALLPGAGKGRRSFDPVGHQVHRRPLRPDDGHRVGQRGRVAAAQGNGVLHSGSASAPTT